MGEAILVQKSSIAAKTQFAAIGVTYPSGSTCTCTNGSITFTDPNTNGQAVFNIPSTGTWTINCTDGTETKSKSVNITAEGQFEKVKLLYREVLYNAGNEYESITGGWIAATAGELANLAHAQKNTDSFRVWLDSVDGAYQYNYRWSYIRTANKISVKDYAEIQMTITEQGHYSSWEGNERVQLILTNSENCYKDNNIASARASTNGAEIVHLPIDSTLTGTYYVGLLCFAGTASRVSATCTKIELIG